SGPKTVGTEDGGSALGYQGIQPSAAVAFNIYSVQNPNSANGHFGETDFLYADTLGNRKDPGGTYLDTTPVELTSNGPIHVTLIYDDVNKTLVETLADSIGNRFAHTYTGIDIPAIVGGTTAYVGLTGGTGGAMAVQTISGFTFRATAISEFAWHGPSSIFTGVTGNPSFVQAIPGTYGTKGNYEVVVPLQRGGLAHFYRNNDDPSFPWSGPYPFATGQGLVNAVSLIQSSLSSAGNGPGNLAVVARSGSQLVYYYRDDLGFAW